MMATNDVLEVYRDELLRLIRAYPVRAWSVEVLATMTAVLRLAARDAGYDASPEPVGRPPEPVGRPRLSILVGGRT